MSASNSDLSGHQLHILQHSLGVDKHGQGNQYRNHFCTGPGSDDFAECNQLVALGMMKDHGPSATAGGMHYFQVTAKGIDAVALQSPPPPKLSRGQLRYREFLRSELNMRFGDWLKWKTRQSQMHRIY